MTTMNSELYDALVSAGVVDEKARAAAMSVADVETHLAHIEGDMRAVKGHLGTLTWMVGIGLALMVGMMWQLYGLNARVAEHGVILEQLLAKLA